MAINWIQFANEMLDVVQELAELDAPGEEKLERLTNEVAEALERVDDLVSFLPLGIRDLAQLVMDNPAVDTWQRTYLARPIAEMLYQLWLGLTGRIRNVD